MRKLFRKFKWSLSNRLLIAAGLALILTSGMSVLCLRNIGEMAALSSTVTESWLPNIQGIAEIRGKLQALRAVQWEIIGSEASKRTNMLPAIESLRGELFIYNKTLSNRIESDDIQKAFDAYSESFAKYEEHADKFVELVKVNKSEEAAALLRADGKSLFETMDAQAKEMDTLSFRGSQAARESVLQKSKEAKQITAVAAPVLFILSMSLLMVLIRRTSGRLSSLAVRLDGGASEIHRQGQSLLETSQKLSSATASEATAIVQTAESINAIQERIAQTTKSAMSTAEAIDQTRDRANVGNRAINEVSEAMRRIEQSNKQILADVEQSHTEMEGISTIMQTIGSKAQVINEIVFQTKLLSFNASVEAARAGEQGKGFSVVAEEIATLARVSGEAAKDIGDILDSSSKNVGEILGKMKSRIGGVVSNSSSMISEGVSRTHVCAEALSGILEAAEQASSLAANIASAVTEQESSIKEINKAVGQLTDLTSQNSSLAENTRHEASSLMSRADDLEALVTTIEIEVKGAANKTLKAS